MYPMWPLRPTAIATPGATASSMETFTILSRVPRKAVSSPELFNPICGSTYLIVCAGITDSFAGGGGGAHDVVMTNVAHRESKAADFILHPGLGAMDSGAE